MMKTDTTAGSAVAPAAPLPAPEVVDAMAQASRHGTLMAELQEKVGKAIAHLTKCLAVEWGKHDITVNAVAPTFIETPGTEACLADPAFRAAPRSRHVCAGLTAFAVRTARRGRAADR